METELAFGGDVGSDVATAGAIVFIDEFHQGLVSLLVHHQILLHLFFDFVQDDVFGEDEVLFLHVLIYFIDVAFLTLISDGHAVCQDFNYSKKLQIKLFFLLFRCLDLRVNVFTLLRPAVPLHLADFLSDFFYEFT